MTDYNPSTSPSHETPMGPMVGGAARKKGAKKGGDMFYYTVTTSTIGASGGRYSSRSGPGAAAKKAASKRFSKSKGSGSKLRLTVRENGTQREFTYDATRTKLAKPVVRKIGGVTVTSEYFISIAAVK